MNNVDDVTLDPSASRRFLFVVLPHFAVGGGGMVAYMVVCRVNQLSETWQRSPFLWDRSREKKERSRSS